MSHITAKGVFYLPRWFGSAAGVDTNVYLTIQISFSRLRPRRLIQHMGALTNLADIVTTPARKSLISMVEREWNNVVERGRKENGYALPCTR